MRKLDLKDLPGPPVKTNEEFKARIERLREPYQPFKADSPSKPDTVHYWMVSNEINELIEYGMDRGGEFFFEENLPEDDRLWHALVSFVGEEVCELDVPKAALLRKARAMLRRLGVGEDRQDSISFQGADGNRVWYVTPGRAAVLRRALLELWIEEARDQISRLTGGMQYAIELLTEMGVSDKGREVLKALRNAH